MKHGENKLVISKAVRSRSALLQQISGVLW